MRKSTIATLVTLIIIGPIIAVIPTVIPAEAAADGWTLVHDGRGVKGYPDLREYVWQKIPIAPPHGTYDKIGLHRLVKTGITPKGVVFISHWMANTPEQWINWPEANWTRYENSSQALYWANRGFDVYMIDYRPGFVPPTLNASQLSFMADWSQDMYMSDLREAVLKTKEISGAKKIFMTDVGLPYGAMNYAARYGKEDIRGIILLGIDLSSLGSAPIGARVGIQTNTYNATKERNDANSKGNWSAEHTGWANFMYAANNPGAPAVNPTTGQPFTPLLNPMTNKSWTNITEFMAYALYISYGAGVLTNIYGGYADPTTIVQYHASHERYRPWAERIDRQAMFDWVNCPYIEYDYDDHWSEISVPMLVFASEKLDNRTGKLRLTNGINTTDFTAIYLKNYGWLDVYAGAYSARDVSEPALQWMVNHYQPLAATATQSSKAVQAGTIASFYTSASGGVPPYTYQWYEGTNPVGNSNLLALYPTTAGTYSYTCKITDSEGTTTNSNTLTLTVSQESSPTPTPQPSASPPPSPSPSPSPTPSPTPSPSPQQTPPAQASSLPQEATIAIAAAIVIAAVAATALVLRKRAK